MNCPSYVMEFDQVRKLVGSFSYAILFRPAVASGQLDNVDYTVKEKTLEIMSKVEAEAFSSCRAARDSNLGTQTRIASCFSVLVPDPEPDPHCPFHRAAISASVSYTHLRAHET
ncbi:MAG: hypothetical protein IMY83_02745 [Chloroflexi bacterium]|nr:hypothetical protein [Chloroflexota bacterium]